MAHRKSDLTAALPAEGAESGRGSRLRFPVEEVQDSPALEQVLTVLEAEGP